MSSVQSDRNVARVLDFWFGILRDNTTMPAAGKQERWFAASKAFDEQCSEAFGTEVERALKGELDDWPQTPRGAVALVLLLDQLTRNVYRHRARAFAGDQAALKVARKAIETGHDAELHPLERAFLYMPFMHSEDLATQERSVEMFRALAETAPPALRDLLESFHRHAIEHWTQIERFGRFPGRNVPLDRTTTPQELKFLKK